MEDLSKSVQGQTLLQFVRAGLVPAIHVFLVA